MPDRRPKPGEFGLIDLIRRQATDNGRLTIGIGDDCAAIRVDPGAEVLVTTDMLMEGRHFLPSDPAEAVGYKCLAVNLSDIAAMAGRPVAAFVAVALPRSRAFEVGSALNRGMLPLAREFGVALAGGDTNAWDGPLVVSVTVLGQSEGRGPVRRSGAKVGDRIFVTGPLGGSLLGRHLSPMPRIREAIALHRLISLHAMIDLSDGLASDLGHILDESGDLGAQLVADSIPIHPDARVVAARDGRPALDHALADGEDFELCFTVDPESARALASSPPTGLRLAEIGTIEEAPGIRLLASDGRVEPIRLRGFDHLGPVEGA